MAIQKRENLSVLKLDNEQRKHLVKEIQAFFKEERDEDLGLIAAETVLDFFLEGLGKVIYNKGLDDSKKWFAKMMNDMEFEFEQLYG